MSSILLLPDRKSPGLTSIGNDVASHTRALEAIRDVLAVRERHTRDKLSSFVRVKELIDLGLVRVVGGNRIELASSSSGGSAATALADLTDVDVSGVVDGDTLQYDATYGLWLPVAPSAGGGGGLTLLGSHVINSAAASLVVSSIPSTYTHLHIYFNGRGDAAGQVVREVYIRFNGDSGSNYDWEDAHAYSSGTGFVQSVGATSGFFGNMPGASATANRSGSCRGLVPNYKGTTFDKQGSGTFGNTVGTGAFNVGSGDFSFGWRPSTPAAITSVTLIPQSGNFVANSGLWVYGL